MTDSPTPKEVSPSRSAELLSWWKSLPGVLKGVAAVITATATLIGSLYTAGFFKSSDDETKRETEPSTQLVRARNEGTLSDLPDKLNQLINVCSGPGSFLIIEIADTGYAVQFVPFDSGAMIDIPVVEGTAQYSMQPIIRQALEELGIPFTVNGNISLQASLSGQANLVAGTTRSLLETAFGIDRDTTLIFTLEGCPD